MICLKGVVGLWPARQHLSRVLSRSLATSNDDIFDVVIVGSGMVGSALAALLATNPLTSTLRVAILDQKPQSLQLAPGQYPDLRVSTITPTSLSVIQRAGAWGELQPHAALFSKMQVWDSSGPGAIRWTSDDVGMPHMGCVVENQLLQSTLLAALQRHAPETTSLVWPASLAKLSLPHHQQQQKWQQGTAGTPNTGGGPSCEGSQGAKPSPSSTPTPGSGPAASSQSASQGTEGQSSSERRAGSGAGPGPGSGAAAGASLAVLELQDGRVMRARLVVAADGAASRVRELAGLRTSGWDYHQRGLVATVRTSVPHDDTAWQRFLPTGPFALLPVRGGLSNIVWSTTPAAARELEGMSPTQFAEAANKALHDPPSAAAPLPLLAQLAGGSDRYQPPPLIEQWVGTSPKSFPLQLKYAGRYVLPRLVLIGDAAHAVHPLAGQGVNLGLGDADALAKALAAARQCGADPGDAVFLQDQYERPRQAANTAMIMALDAVKRTFALQATPFAALRSLGLDALNMAGPIKNKIMQYAMGL